jgi:hypothetical protein
MLLNFSNHPLASWPQRQMDMALQTYDSVEDLPFPQVDPNFNEVALDNLVEEYFQIILKKKPKAVHVMGELTFCVAIIKRFQKAQINCLASTTHRSTEDRPDGTKVSKFEFVRFRHYWP